MSVRLNTMFRYLPLLMAALSAGTAVVDVDIVSGTACEVCRCVAGENPRDVVHCDGLKAVSVSSFPRFANKLIVSNSTAVVFKRGSIQIRKSGRSRKFQFSLRTIKSVRFDEKSVNLHGSEFEAQIDILLSDVDESRFVEGFLTADSSGTVNFKVENAGNVHVEGGSFDLLSTVHMDGVRTLNLKPLGLKQNLPPASYDPEFKAVFRNVFIPTIPTDSFPSSKELIFEKCRISDVEVNSFSGFNMGTIRFSDSSIDRLHGRGFPDKSLVEELTFENCSISSVSQKAIVSTMSSLKVVSTSISSVSPDSLHCQAAKINLTGNSFTTLSENSFRFKSWTDLIIDANDFQFLEAGSLAGIRFSNGSKTFSFSGNRIHYANQDGLLLAGSADLTGVSGNVFYRECDCEFERWLDVVAGVGSAPTLANTSLCRVPGFSAGCYEEEAFVPIPEFRRISCSGGAVKCRTSGLKRAWDSFQKRIEVTTDKGILLIVLLFSLASCFVVGLLTFFRWIVFTVRTRDDAEPEDQWNFTKVEEKKFENAEDHETSSEDREERHYESLPLTATEVLVESHTSSPQQALLPEVAETVIVVEDLKPPDVLEQVPAGEKPKQQTFYDEMICLLKEKLDDPDNYATVADTDDDAKESQHLLYQDPHDVSGSGAV